MSSPDISAVAPTGAQSDPKREAVRAALRKAIEACTGSQSELARRMGAPYCQQHISHWLKAGKVPAEHVRRIVKASSGAVAAHDLCPDVFAEDDGAGAAAA